MKKGIKEQTFRDKLFREEPQKRNTTTYYYYVFIFPDDEAFFLGE
jgi:hypothetical protein